MNCQDITRILDDGDIARLTAAERASVEMHLSACPDCAEDWRIHQRLAARAVPAVPHDLAARCRELVAGGKVRRATGRVIVFGAVLVFAAAAAMLADWLATTPATDTAPVAAVAPAQASVQGGLDAPASALPSTEDSPAADGPVAQPAPQAQPKTHSQSASFTVHLVLDTAGADATLKAVLEKYYNGFARELPTVPGLRLLTGGSEGQDAGVADYVITIKPYTNISLSNSSNQAKVNKVNIDASVNRRAGSGRSAGFSMMEGVSGPEEVQVDHHVKLLRLSTFPPDPLLQQELVATLLNPQLEFRARENALVDLRVVGVLPSQSGRLPPDPAVVRGAVELASAAPDSAARIRIWSMLSALRDPELVAPLVQALRTETDEKPRLYLMTVLARNYGTDLRARAELEAVAQNDQRQIVRMAALRGLSGDAGWMPYAVATLKDTRLTELQRLEPLAYMASSGQRSGQVQLDDDAVRTLGSLLANVGGDSSTVDSTVGSAATVLLSMGTPVSLDVLIDIMRPGEGQSQSTQVLRRNLLPQLAIAYGGNPRVRALVEEIIARDPDQRLRESARSALQVMERVNLPDPILQQGSPRQP